MSLKTQSLVLCATLGALLLGGLGCKSANGTVGGVALPKRVALEYWTVYDDVDAIQAVLAPFKAAGRSYLSVNVRQFRPEDIYPRLVEALAEDKGPDIISVSNRSVGTYLSKLAPMPPTVKDTTVIVTKGQFSETTQVNTISKPTVTLDQLQREYVSVVAEDAVRGGQIYGLPLSLDTMAIFYNKDLLDRAGIAEAPKTWEEFQEDVKKLTKYDKASGKIVQSGAVMGTGANVPWSDDILYVLFKQSGVPFVNKAGQATFNVRPPNSDGGAETPAMQVMNFYTDFANPTRDTYTWNDTMPNGLEAFVQGRAAFFLGYSFDYPLIKTRAPQLNFDVIPLLQLNPEAPANAANYSIEAVTAKSKNQNEAWNVVTYLAHSNATKDYLLKSGRPTALRTYLTAQKNDLALAPFVTQLLSAGNWYHGANYEASSQAVKTLLKDWLVVPADPERVLIYWQNALNRAAAQVNQTF